MPSAPSDCFEVFSDRVRVHQAGLRAYIRALGIDEAWVDDLAQEAFLVAFRKFSSFDRDADFGKWLRGIARNLVVNERRKQARHSRILNGALTDLLLEKESCAEPFSADTGTLVSVMHNCMETLPPRSRHLMHLRYAEGENASMLAERFTMKAEAVRQTLVRIRIIVKRCIEQKLQETPQ